MRQIHAHEAVQQALDADGDRDDMLALDPPLRARRVPRFDGRVRKDERRLHTNDQRELLDAHRRRLEGIHIAEKTNVPCLALGVPDKRRHLVDVVIARPRQALDVHGGQNCVFDLVQGPAVAGAVQMPRATRVSTTAPSTPLRKTAIVHHTGASPFLTASAESSNFGAARRQRRAAGAPSQHSDNPPGRLRVQPASLIPCSSHDSRAILPRLWLHASLSAPRRGRG